MKKGQLVQRRRIIGKETKYASFSFQNYYLIIFFPTSDVLEGIGEVTSVTRFLPNQDNWEAR